MGENVNDFENVSMDLIVQDLRRSISFVISSLVLYGVNGLTGHNAVPLVGTTEPNFEQGAVSMKDSHLISVKEQPKINRLVNSMNVRTGMNGIRGRAAQQLVDMDNKREPENVCREDMDVKEETKS